MLGPIPAGTLMELLPDPPELATKSDLRSLHDLLDGQFRDIDQRFENIDDRRYEFHESLRSYARPS